ncbi:MAG: hypothetical protein ACREDR_28680 [Blastocatellia bacterium]
MLKNDYRDKFDIFVCGGSRHFDLLYDLLPRLAPFGRTHLASITLTARELDALGPYCDLVHRPLHHPDGYINFNLFCIRDINRLAQGKHFIKLDADIKLPNYWIEYVERSLRLQPDAVLFGPEAGGSTIDIEITGPAAVRQLGREIRVRKKRKICGLFHVGRTEFFKQHDAFMQSVHRLLFANDPANGAATNRELEPESKNRRRGLEIKGYQRNLRGIGDEDTLRSLVVHALGAGDRMFMLDGPSVGLDDFEVDQWPLLDERAG